MKNEKTDCLIFDSISELENYSELNAYLLKHWKSVLDLDKFIKLIKLRKNQIYANKRQSEIK